MDETITRDEYNERKASINSDLKSFTKQLEKLKSDKDDSISLTEDVFDFIVTVRDDFNSGTLKQKKLIFSFFGENFRLKDWVLALELHSWLSPIIEEYPKLERIYRSLEPIEKASSKQIPETYSHLILLWSGGRGLNSHTQGLKP